MRLTREQYEEMLKRPGIRQANPALGAVARSINPQPSPALVKDAPAKQSRKGSVAVCVEIIGLRRRLLDSDNFTAGGKPLRDAIAESIGIDDGSERIQFSYGQVQTTGTEGTIVRITWL